MKIDGIFMDDIYKIEYNYDNLKILQIVHYLINVVVNDIEYMNQDFFEDDEREKIENFVFDLGNGKTIKQEDLESLVSIVDNTILDIIDYNKEEEQD